MRLDVRRIIVYWAAVIIPVVAWALLKNSGAGVAMLSVLVVFAACVPFVMSFEGKGKRARLAVVIAVMAAMSSGGRIAFAAIPGFKPVTAITVITGMYFGREAGYMTGALSALISNMALGQGPWTPFQMFAWGIMGFVSGLDVMSGLLKTDKLVLIMGGAAAGVGYSLIMDIWTTVSIYRELSLRPYLSVMVSSIPFMAVYAVSNVIFLLLLVPFFGPNLEKIKEKYEL